MRTGPRREPALKEMVRPEGLEPPAYWFEASRSIQLSYGRTPERFYREPSPEDTSLMLERIVHDAPYRPFDVSD
jgi:hypothetical protein